MKKAEGLPLNTIIIAAIVLIVLIVLWAIFTGRMGGFTTGVKKQTEVQCPSENNWKDACGPNEIIVPVSDPTGQGRICCKAAGE